MIPPPCECPVAGWCKRHAMHKGAHLWNKCQSNERHREIMDAKTAGKPESVERLATYVIVGNKITITAHKNGTVNPRLDSVPGDPATGSIPCGDIAKVIIEKIGAAKAHRLFMYWLGKEGVDCGCAQRQERLNKACAKIEAWVRRVSKMKFWERR